MKIAQYENLNREQVIAKHGNKLGALIWVHLVSVRDDNRDTVERDINRFIAREAA